MLRMAVVGVGWAGSRQVEAIGELGRKVEVDCLVDPDANFLREKSVELEIEKTYTSFDEVLRDNAINAVSICSPHPFHCAQAIAAAEA
ncbi:MAG: putative dehydrogenase, partial [Candidatus Latescibacterota bacterium]